MTELSDEEIQRFKLLEKRAQRRLQTMNDIQAKDACLETVPEAWQTPASWAILTELYRARFHCERVSIRQLKSASGAPEATVDRYLDLLFEDGWITKRPSSDDQRGDIAIIGDSALALLDEWLDSHFHDSAEPSIDVYRQSHRRLASSQV